MLTQPFTRLLIATRNPGKAREYRDLLADLPLEVTWLDAEGIELEVEESGQTFEENAIIKATEYARASGLLTWADDSGLEVDYLHGWPGVESARHAGPNASDQDRVQILLQKLEDVPFEKRGAVFRCVVALATPDGEVQTAAGSSSGVIARAPAGENGFGYDPVFIIPKFGCTYAELSSEAKHTVSHRGRAAHRARALLQTFLALSPRHSPQAP